MIPKNYKDNFFDLHLQGSLNSARETIPVVMEFLKPTSVIDIGCGVGTWLCAWKENGIKEIHGVDGTYVDIKKLLIHKEEFTAFDLEKGYTSNRKYDLVTCLEVAEHIKLEYAQRFIQSLSKLGDVVLFSAAIPGQEGTLHFNEQFPSYWIELFKENGFTPYDCLREKLWSNSKIEWWYRQNIMFYVREDVKSDYPSITAHSKTISSLIHPDLFQSKLNKIAGYERALSNPFRAAKYFIRKYFMAVKTLFRK